MISQRILRLSIYHYFNPDKPESEVYEFATNDHAVKAVKIHQQHGLLGYSLVSYDTLSAFVRYGALSNGNSSLNIQVYAPKRAQKLLFDWKEKFNRNWVLEDYDAAVEFYFKDFDSMNAIAQDPGFHRLQQEELPFIDQNRPPKATFGWVEAYIVDGKIVNIKDDRSTFPPFKQLADIVYPGVSE
ncbi:uncharacterized protein BHQ10_009311 [Talaromyces amestolkiae]|uniref:EthD domain-containing protein n=1 Tax=Talaromyces amestolkiae TaxID=1196081 RepID=A0A364LBZ2_TALAM|nr:uncharacterized protein BHQ10_009311 [Talaromyces amestolkiae]RAO73299.1 hypothetical protein BHQ10_009311 [Talaromyces amestolkiae]